MMHAFVASLVRTSLRRSPGIRAGLLVAILALACPFALSAPVLADDSSDEALSTPADGGMAVAAARGGKQTFDLDGDGKVDISVPLARCNESVFMPTICWENAPKDIQYRPKHEQCGGNAAILLGGKFSSSYSVVLRDKLNRDRFPPCSSSGSNFGNCSFSECDTLGLNRCSAWKCQRTFKTRVGRKRVQTCCLGDSGDSALLSKTTRLTIKLRDDPTSNLDPLVRVALKRNNPKKRLN